MSITIIKTYDRNGGKVWTQSLRPLCHPDLGTRFCNPVCAIQQQTKDLHRQRKEPIVWLFKVCLDGKERVGMYHGLFLVYVLRNHFHCVERKSGHGL